MNEQEIWETTVPGRVTVSVTNSRGRPQDLSVVGAGQRLRISPGDRELVEEGIRDQQNNPFRNGVLYQVGGPKASEPASPDALSDDDLKAAFDATGSDFESIVEALSEVNIRRLKQLTGPVDASRSQIEFLDKIIAERYPVGGDTPTYREMQGVR